MAAVTLESSLIATAVVYSASIGKQRELVGSLVASAISTGADLGRRRSFYTKKIATITVGGSTNPDASSVLIPSNAPDPIPDLYGYVAPKEISWTSDGNVITDISAGYPRVTLQASGLGDGTPYTDYSLIYQNVVGEDEINGIWIGNRTDEIGPQELPSSSWFNWGPEFAGTGIPNFTIGFEHQSATLLSTANLSVQMAIQASAQVSVTTAADLQVRNPTMSVALSVETSIVGTIGKYPAFNATLIVSAISAAKMSTRLALASKNQIDLVVKACLDAGRDGLGVCDVIRDILILWGYSNVKSTPGYVRRRALHDLNAALQTVWNQARDRNYWTNSTLEFTLAAGAQSYDLSDEIQNVIGPARIKDSRRQLSPIGTVEELEQFQDLFLSGNTASKPIAYHIHRTNQAGKDPVKCTFLVTPPPGEDTAFLLDVVNEAPRYNWNDFDTCRRIPIPHRYIESLLLPIVRHQATSYYLFTNEERKASIEAEYQQAIQLLDSADPLPGKAGDNINRRTEQKT
ncbi:hypothetical protein JIN85_14660 [Luteolibacter pohnpeiensis]|uniref:Uncharacterized protein n=1 Tax=Luteolibacter pohnpeiensis TaxID=454153 RepID=A0A934S5W0_9BACT|nr:hypothetical protein [Luteolibacter pohnpeiensis]MBK1883660.1 hypothetical protein [Luteolibacter pohnpeiensis]